MHTGRCFAPREYAWDRPERLSPVPYRSARTADEQRHIQRENGYGLQGTAKGAGLSPEQFPRQALDLRVQFFIKAGDVYAVHQRVMRQQRHRHGRRAVLHAVFPPGDARIAVGGARVG